MNRFLCWVEAVPAAKLNALLGAAVFAGISVLIGIQSVTAFVVQIGWGRVIEVPEVWVAILNSMLLASAAWAGVALAAQIGRRATTNPAVIDAEARAKAGGQ